VNGYSRAYSTALSHNYGAGRFDRIREAGKASRIDGNILCLALAALSLLICRPLNRFILADASKQAVTYSGLCNSLNTDVFHFHAHPANQRSAESIQNESQDIHIKHHNDDCKGCMPLCRCVRFHISFTTYRHHRQNSGFAVSEIRGKTRSDRLRTTFLAAPLYYRSLDKTPFLPYNHSIRNR